MTRLDDAIERGRLALEEHLVRTQAPISPPMGIYSGSTAGQHQLSDTVIEFCKNLWDIHNTRSNEVEAVRRRVDAETNNRDGFAAMKQHARDWDRTAIMEYHMGNITLEDGAAIHWAIRNGTSKIKLIESYIGEDVGMPTNLDTALRDIRSVQRVLRASGKDELQIAFIQNYWNFWDALDEDQLYEI